MEQFLNKITLGDSRELIKQIADESVSIIVQDPPYGIAFQSGLRKDKFDVLKGDDAADFSILPELYRVLKPNSAIYTYTSYQVYSQWEQELKKYFDVKNMCIWAKGGGGMGDLEGAFAVDFEICIFAVKGRHILNPPRSGAVWKLRKDAGAEYVHPTQKPMSAMEWPILKSSKPGDIVLDPYMGSGTTAMAAINSGRQFIGFEIDPKYHAEATKRVNNKLATPTLNFD